jgi:hypothetical protein
MNLEVVRLEDLFASLRERFAAATAGKVGLVQVQAEQRPFPVWLRAGTDDVEAASVSFDPQMNGLKLVHQPRRILEIGAGPGFRSAALAHAYPGAEIIAIEADAGCHRAAKLNTLPYGNITSLNAIIAADAARYDFHGRAGADGRLSLVRDNTGSLAATPLAQLLSQWRWRDVDTLILKLDAASETILDGVLPPELRLLAVENGGEPLAPGVTARLAGSGFLAVVSGDYVLLYRREQPKALLPLPRPQPVFEPDGPARALRLENVREGGFFPVGRHGFRLPPNAWNESPARLSVMHENFEHGELQVSMRVPLEATPPVRFTVKVLSETGKTLAAANEVLKGGTARGTVIFLPEHQGRWEIVFTTEMAERGASNAGVWAEFISATLV